MATEISNREDIIDSRDVEARIEELESDIETEQEAIEEQEEILEDEEATEDAKAEAQDAINTSKDTIEDLQEELDILIGLRDEASGFAADWYHGVALIHEDYFQTYAEDLASDIGAIDRNASWPLNHIDWEAAAEELKSDYIEVDFDGETYYVR